MAINVLSPIAPLADTGLLAAQAAAKTTTVLYAVPATQGGLYVIKFYLKVTRAATTSSTLGPLTITFTDSGDSVAQSVVALAGTSAGAAATTAANGTTTTILQGQVVVNAKAGTNISYAVGYASAGATTMTWEGRVTVVAP